MEFGPIFRPCFLRLKDYLNDLFLEKKTSFVAVALCSEQIVRTRLNFSHSSQQDIKMFKYSENTGRKIEVC